MDKPFFVMMYNQKGDYAETIVDDNNETMFWHTKGEAEEAMRGHVYAEAFGFEVHEMGSDCA